MLSFVFGNVSNSGYPEGEEQSVLQPHSDLILYGRTDK